MAIDIKQIAKSHGVSLVELAERLGVSRQTVHYYCEQADKNPVTQLQKIADAIDCKLSEFFEDETPDNSFLCPHCGKPIEVRKPE